MGVTSGSFETSHRISGSYNTYAKFSWSQSSQSVANNSTTITWKLVGCTANQYQWIHVYGISVTINGTAQSVSWSGDMYNGTQMASGTVTIPHNADGTKTFSASASIHQYSTASSDWYSGSGSWTLNQIARAATISSAPNFNDEANPTITYNNAAGTAVSTLQACIASTDGQTIYVPYRDISKTGTSYTFSLTESERNTLRAACAGNSMNVRFYIKTVIGSTTLYDSVQKTLSIVNANPTFSNFTYSDTNSTITAITGNNQYLVQGKSTLQVQVSTANKATAKKSATMSSYQSSISGLTANGTYSSSAAVNMTFSSNAFTPGSQTLAVKAIDSRGNSTSVSKSVNVLAYAAPTISASATRANNFENNTTLHIEGAYSPLTISGTAKNTVSSVQYRYKQQSTSTWGSWTNMSGLNVTSAGRYTTTNIVLSLDNSYAWDVQVKTVDRISTTTVSLVVSAGIAIFRIGTDGYVYNNEKRLITIDEAPLYSTHVGQVIMTTTFTTVAAVQAYYGGTWERWGQGRVPVSVDPNDSDFNASNKTGGAKTVTLQESQLPKHRHPIDNNQSGGDYDMTYQYELYISNNNATLRADHWCRFTGLAGGGEAHQNMPPYQTIYMYRRTA